MTDLPIASISSAPATATRPTANALPCATPVRNGTPQPNASPFQDALALELGLGLDDPLLPGLVLPGLGVPAAAAKTIKPGEDTAQTAIAADAPLSLALIGVPPLPPALASFSPPAASAAAPLLPAFAPAGTERAGLALYPRKDPLARTSAAQNAEPELPIAAAVADFAVPGRIPPSAAGEIRSEVAFDTSLLDQHKAAPAQSAAIPTGGAAPVQVTQAPVAALEARVGERGWDQGLGDKLVWMAGHGQQVAELHLNPPDLGPLKITLTLNHDQASAQFVSAHAPVREAIEAAMPRLREMLADSGITLGNASVSTDAFREQAQPQHQSRAYPAPPAAAAADQGAVTRGERLLRRSHGLVDTFA